MFNTIKDKFVGLHDKNTSLSKSLLLVSIILFAPLALMALANKPIADDFDYFSDPLISSPVSYIADFYTHKTGRVSQAALISVLYKLFGSESVVYGTIILLLLLVLSSGALLWSLSRSIKLKVSNELLLANSFLLSILVVLTSPSLYDTTLWLTSSTVYIGSIIALFIVIAMVLYTLSLKRVSFKWIVALSVTTFFAQLFSEPTSIILIIGSGTALLTCIFLKQRKAAYFLLATTLSAIAGFIFLYLSPGSQSRRSASGSSFDPYNMFVSSLNDFSHLSYLIDIRHLVIIVLAAFSIAILIPSVKKLSKKVYLLLGLFFMVGIVSGYTLFVVTRYSMGGYIPLRSLTVVSVIVSLSLSLCMGTLISLVTYKLFKERAMIALKYSVMVVSSIAIFILYPYYNIVLHSLHLRASLFDSREIAIRNERDTQHNEPTIAITPAPILLVETEAIDFYYNSSTQPEWFEKSFKRYYNISPTSKLEYLPQPRSYCVTSYNPTWFGAKSCYILQESEKGH